MLNKKKRFVNDRPHFASLRLIKRSVSCLNFWVVFILLGVSGCQPPASPPKPRGFHRLIFPEKAYRRFENPNCPFSFEYPVYGELELGRIDSCFLNIYFPQFKSRWHITSRFFDNRKVNLDYTLEDHRAVVYHHAQKGIIYEKPIATPYGFGKLYELEGEVPTYLQVYFTDSTRYAFLAHCYFNSSEKNDSLAPVIQFLRKDVQHLIQTLRWK
jgi:gliding motility-associated lipoprotein GldD